MQYPKKQSSLLSLIWPVPVWVVGTTIIPYMLWTSCLVNAGYTKWFHWNSFLYLLTQNPFQCKLLALQGLTVTLGWYASLMFDWLYLRGQFGRILYWNMPLVLAKHMIDTDNTSLLVYDTMESRISMIVSHILDTLGHPLLAYYYWQRTWRNGNGRQGQVLTWPVLVAAYALSRLWSVVQTYHNHGKFGLFYFGYDVYDILDKDAWMEGMWLPAYIMEGLVFVIIVLYKLLLRSGNDDEAAYQAIVGQTKKSDDHDSSSPSATRTLDKLPSLLRASTVSETEKQ